MDFSIPESIQQTLRDLDAFIEREIKPLQAQDDNERFFDHRREWARTDYDNDGVPRADWEELLREMRRRADAAGWLRLALPPEFGGRSASNLEMAIIREHLATKGLGLFNDLQNESSVVGNFPTVLMMRDFGTEAQKEEWMPGFLNGTKRLAFGLTEPNHGSDATYLETTAVRDGDEWIANGQKVWTTLAHLSRWGLLIVRTDSEAVKHAGMTAFVVDMQAPGVEVRPLRQITGEAEFNEVYMTDARVPDSQRVGEIGEGWRVALTTLMNERTAIGGGGGNRTRVRKPYIPGPTCLAVSLILVVHYPSGREDDRPAQERFSEPALSTLDPRACERVPRVWMHKHMPVEG